MGRGKGARHRLAGDPFAGVLGGRAGSPPAGGWSPGGFAAVAVVAACVWSNVLAYRDVSLAPRDQLVELEQIGELVEGEGPSLMTAYEPYGARHFLREATRKAVSELRRNVIPLRGGDTVEKGISVDTDESTPTPCLLPYARAAPLARPEPAARRRTGSSGEGDSTRSGSARRARPRWQRIGLGDRYDPIAEPDCAEVTRLAGQW